MPVIRNSHCCAGCDLGCDGASAPAPRKTHKKSKNSSHDLDKQAEHIRRPRNAFIIFRSCYVRQVKAGLDAATGSGVQQQNKLSQSAGMAWKAMDDEARQPYVEAARNEKEWHRQTYPDYVYAPAGVGVKTGKKGKSPVGKASTHAGPNPETANETRSNDWRVGRTPPEMGLTPTNTLEPKDVHKFQPEFWVDTWWRSMCHNDLLPTADAETDCRVGELPHSSPDATCGPPFIPEIPFGNLGRLDPHVTFHPEQARTESLLPPFQTPIQLAFDPMDFESVLARDLGLTCGYEQSGVAVENGLDWNLYTGGGYF